MGATWFLLSLQIFCMFCGIWAQRSPYSLQAAVDELHRREAAKYPLNAPPPPSQSRYFTGALGTAAEQDYWDDDSDFSTNTNPNNQNRNRHLLNKALAKYLERESYDNDRGGLSLGPFGGYEFDEDNNQLILEPDEKKRSSYFRERDSKYDLPPSSIFRERETQSTPSAGISIPERSELTEQFLREIEEAQEREREERYKDALRNLWEKYQHQENEIEGDLLEEKKRVRMPPYYMLMQKKRSYPVLPWLPYAERKKRFPITKRTTKRATNENNNNNLEKTDDKVAKELSELFGSASTSATSDEKKKRSIDEQLRTSSSTRAPTTTSTTDMLLEVPSKKDNSTEAAINAAPSSHQHGHEHVKEHAHSGGHVQKEHKHRKRSNHHGSHESHEDEEEGSESEEHDEEEGEEEDEDEFDEEEAEERKKKRDLSEAKRLSLELPVQTKRLSKLRQKKSIDWSKYFGLDRKKKSVKRENAAGVQVKKRSTSDDDADNIDQDKKKHNLDPEKIDNMDRKLQSIEDFIIDETIKYTGAHEGIANPGEIRRLKDHVLSRLATVYSLEKMRRALEKLRQSVETENHLLRNVIEPEDRSENELEKRVAVKKEQAPLNELENIGLLSGNDKTKEIHSNAMMSTSSADASNKNDDSIDVNDELETMKKHKKKRNGYLRYPDLPNEFTDADDVGIAPGHYESLNDAYLGNKNYIIGSNQCPLIESMSERCRGVDLLSGDINQELLPICGVHQICYLCGTSQVACDYQYLAEADSICGNNNDCQAAARSILMILRGTPGPQLGPRECLKNSCLHSAMREIGL